MHSTILPLMNISTVSGIIFMTIDDTSINFIELLSFCPGTSLIPGPTPQNQLKNVKVL